MSDSPENVTQSVSVLTPDVTAQIAVLDTKLDGLVEDVTEIKGFTSETNGRVRSLERWRERIKGNVAAFAVLGPVLTGVATALICLAVTGQSL